MLFLSPQHGGLKRNFFEGQSFQTVREQNAVSGILRLNGMEWILGAGGTPAAPRGAV